MSITQLQQAITVTGIRAIKRYPKEPMKNLVGTLNGLEIAELINHQECLIKQLQESNKQLNQAVNPILWAPAGFGKGCTLCEVITAEDPAITDQRMLNEARVNEQTAEKSLTEIKRILNKGKQTDMFKDTVTERFTCQTPNY